MFKKVFLLFVASIFIFSTLGTVVYGKSNNAQKCGTPFMKIWNELQNHEDRINYLEEQPNGSVLAVYDADGQFLGNHLFADYSTVYIHIPSFGKDARIISGTGELSNDPIYFKSYDCSGTPYVLAGKSYVIFGNGNGKYYTGEMVAPVNMTTHSTISSTSSECKQYNKSTNYVPADEVTLPFTLPVALPLSIEVE